MSSSTSPSHRVLTVDIPALTRVLATAMAKVEHQADHNTVMIATSLFPVIAAEASLAPMSAVTLFPVIAAEASLALMSAEASLAPTVMEAILLPNPLANQAFTVCLATATLATSSTSILAPASASTSNAQETKSSMRMSASAVVPKTFAAKETSSLTENRALVNVQLPRFIVRATQS
jgi:hypothetical protein